MIKRAHERFIQPRPNVRGGEGTAVFAHMLSEEERPASCRLFATITLPAGGSIGVHEHQGEREIFYILQGTARYNDNGTACTVGAGDTTMCRSGESHGIANIGDDELVMVAVIWTE